MDLLTETLAAIQCPDETALAEARAQQDRLTKPRGALGSIEDVSVRLAGLAGTCPPTLPEPAAVTVMAADHGVHAQGVTSWPQEVTAQMATNVLAGGAVVNTFAAQVAAEVRVVDVGVATELPAAPGLVSRKVRSGTADMTLGPAMRQDEARRAIEVGVRVADDCIQAGHRCLVTGDMGIANTTAAAALVAAFTGHDAAAVTGRGTGIDERHHEHKVRTVQQALDLHRPSPADPLGSLSAVGGLEHAALAGLILGAAAHRVPVVLDGVIAGSAALAAAAFTPDAASACFAGHRSAEPGHRVALHHLGLEPLIALNLRLGEGTGALLALPVVQSAARTLHDVATFDSAGVADKN